MTEDQHYFYARQYAYDLLRRIFLEEPTVELMQYLQQDKNLKRFPFSSQNATLQNALKLMIKYLKRAEFELGQDDFENLHWDYTRMFIGPEVPPAPLWESVYFSKDKLLFQKSTDDVNKFYAQCGFQLNEKEQEAADHIGFELDFMYHLGSQSIQHIDKNTVLKNLLQQQNQFLKTHLLAFSSKLGNKITEHTDSDFYRTVAILLQEFLPHDQQWVEAVLHKKVRPRWQ